MHYRDIFLIFFNMKVYCVFSLESPHRGDSNMYTQYTIFCKKKKNENHLRLLYCVFSLESPHRGDSNMYTQYTIFFCKKTKITSDYSKSAAMRFFPRHSRTSSK